MHEHTPAHLTVTEEFARARDLLEHGEKHLFLTGKAGTGKSTFLHYFRERTEKNVAVLAPTGVAALNVKGQTIHSFFRFAPAFLVPGQKRKGAPERKRLYKALDIVVIDEISMVRADMFDAIESYLRTHGKHPGKPFGGVTLCIIGDVYQLPPIVTRSEADLFKQYYKTPHFFGAHGFDPDAFEMIELSRIFRQSVEERAFITVLNGVRDGSLSSSALDAFNQLTVGRHKTFSDNDTPVALTAHNDRADEINRRNMVKLEASEYVFQAKAKGSFAKLTDGRRLPAPCELILKEGARVMFLKNDAAQRWANGTVGTVETLAQDTVKIRVGAYVYDVEPESWEDIRYSYDADSDDVGEEKAGSYTQYPLQPAWAITIHKSQSKTFDKVIIDLARGAFAPGQAYVALSRCRTQNGVSLTCPLRHSDIRIDPEIVRFMQDLRGNT